jgi:hypothetical protein
MFHNNYNVLAQIFVAYMACLPYKLWVMVSLPLGPYALYIALRRSLHLSAVPSLASVLSRHQLYIHR